MSSYSPHPSGGRAQLGSPIIHINSPGAYLRHRTAAERQFQLRMRSKKRRWIVLALAAIIFYFAIGRELLQLGCSTSAVASTLVRKDTHRFSLDIRRLIKGTKNKAAEAAEAYAKPAEELEVGDEGIVENE